MLLDFHLKGTLKMGQDGAFIQQGLIVAQEAEPHTADGIHHILGGGQLAQHIFHKMLGARRDRCRIDEAARFQLAKLPMGLSLAHFGQDKAFVLLLAKVDALNRAGVDDGRMAVLRRQHLRLVDVAQGHVIELFVVYQATAEHQLVPQHDGSFAAVLGPLHAAWAVRMSGM
jgi:hypothetical protein